MGWFDSPDGTKFFEFVMFKYKGFCDGFNLIVRNY